MTSKKRKQNTAKGREGKSGVSAHNRGRSLSLASNSTSTSASLLPLVAFAALSSLVLYGNTCENEFVYDDLVAVVQNPDVRGERTISDLLRNDFWGATLASPGSHKSYRPITTLAYRLTASWAGMEPRAFHIVNSFVNAIAVALAVKCIDIVSRDVQGMSGSKDRDPLRVFGMPTFQVIATALFLFHPIHTESVNGIVGLADLLAATFGFLAFVFHDMSMSNTRDVARQSIHLLICLVLSWLSALSKETGLMILAICGAREIARCWLPWLSRKSNNAMQLSIIRFTMLGSTGVAFLLFRKSINGQNTGIVLGDSVCDNPLVTAKSTLSYVLSALLVLSVYLWKLINPFALLVCDWGYNTIPLIEGWNDPRNLASLAAIGGVTMTTIIGLKKAVDKDHPDGRLLVGLAWVIGPLLPASHIFTIGTVLAERLLFVPSLGSCMLAGVLVERFQTLLSQKKRSSVTGNFQAVLVPLLVLILAVLAQRISTRNADWKDNRTLWNRDFHTNPKNVKLAKAYASELELAGKLDEAFHVIKDITGLGPYQRVEVCLVKSRVIAMSSAAGRNYDLGHRILDECIAEVEALPKMTTNSHQLYGSKAYLFHFQGRIKEAVPFFERAAFVAEKVDKRNLQPVCNVGEIYGAANRWEEAVGHLERCVAWGERAREVKERRAPALGNLGVAYMRTGQYAKASSTLKKSINLHQTDQAIKHLNELQKHLEEQNKSN